MVGRKKICAAMQLSKDEADLLRDVGMDYWRRHQPGSFDPRPWEVDPLMSAQGQAERSSSMIQHRDEGLADQHVAYRFYSRRLRAQGK